METPEGDFHIPRKGVGPAMNGDVVAVRKDKRYSAKGPQATVVRVDKRAVDGFIGRFETDGIIRVVIPLDDRLAHDFFLDPADPSPKKLNAKDGDIVYAKITLFPSRKSAGMVTLERFVGKPSDKNLAIEQVIASHGLATSFSERTLAEANSLTLNVEEALQDPLRRDLRGKLVVTVDPADAKDFDDAVSFEPQENGTFMLGVHIADVSHYVAWESSIDISARQRSTSTYLVDRVLPMLPKQLSNNLCSLKPHEDRLAMTVMMHLNAEYEVLSADFFPSVIKSSYRFSYDEVDQILKDSSAQTLNKIMPTLIPQKQDAVAAMLKGLNTMAHARKARREERGGIDFDTTETKVILNEEKKPVGVSIRKRTDATSLIEESMLAANESVAIYLSNHSIPAAFRVHERPSEDALASLLPLLQEFGYDDEKTVARVLVGNPSALQSVINRAKGRPEEYLISQSILRSMKRADYQPYDAGHYGLNMDSYCHFTSPIRRYPDLIVHRALKAALLNTLPKSERQRMGKRMQKVTKAIESQNSLLPDLCKHASVMERESDEAAMQSQKIKLAEYMEQFIDQAFSGVITGVETFGLFVRLDETTAEGLLPIKKLGDDWFNYDFDRKALIGESTHKSYRLGQRIAVVVDEVDIPAGYVNFRLPNS